jgi:hypothetical protein
MPRCRRAAVIASRQVCRRAVLPKKNASPSGLTATTPRRPAELLLSLPKPVPITFQCWVNPWSDLAVLIPPAELSQRVFAYTQLWGVLSTIMCTASVTTLLGFPHVPDPQHLVVAAAAVHDCSTNNNDPTNQNTNHNNNDEPGEPLLAIFIPKAKLHDFYIGTSLLSFFSGGIALGVATVTNITGFLVPAEFLGLFVQRHSLLLGSLPGLTVISGGLLGMSVVTGVDLSDRGGPLSKLAVYGYLVATMFIGATSLSGHAALVRGIARAKRRRMQPC